MKKTLAALTTVALTLALAAATTAAAKPQTLDNYCSETGDICQAILLSKSGSVKFELLTPSFSGEYTICVKAMDPKVKECKDFELESAGSGTYADKVNWQKNFDKQFGNLKVVWKLNGDKIGKALSFTSEPANSALQ